jgi:hypothetical protein
MTPSKHPARTSGRTHPSNAHQHAHAIADAHAWHRAHGAGEIEIPLSIIGALSLLSPPDDEREWTVTTLQAAPLDQFRAIMCAQWAIFARYRSDLLNRAWPLISIWHGEQPLTEEKLVAAKQVSDAAISVGLLSLTGTERRRDTDLFGPLLVALRPDSARETRGQFYTPGDLADAITHLMPPAEGDSVLEPAVGTGGMLRSAAEALRARGDDPAKVHWCAVDIDELAVACLCVNVVLWELGHDVVLGVGNSLADDWIDRVLAERRETVEIARTAATMRAVMQLLRSGDRS